MSGSMVYVVYAVYLRFAVCGLNSWHRIRSGEQQMLNYRLGGTRILDFGNGVWLCCTKVIWSRQQSQERECGSCTGWL